MRLTSFQKYIVFYDCKVVISFMATTSLSMLAPFSQILNRTFRKEDLFKQSIGCHPDIIMSMSDPALTWEDPGFIQLLAEDFDVIDVPPWLLEGVIIMTNSKKLKKICKEKIKISMCFDGKPFRM